MLPHGSKLSLHDGQCDQLKQISCLRSIVVHSLLVHSALDWLSCLQTFFIQISHLFNKELVHDSSYSRSFGMKNISHLNLARGSSNFPVHESFHCVPHAATVPSIALNFFLLISIFNIIFHIIHFISQLFVLLPSFHLFQASSIISIIYS